MTELTFKGKPAIWDSDIKEFVTVERSRVKVVRTTRPVHWRYCRFVGVVTEDAGDLLEVQTYGGTRAPLTMVFERKPARLMPHYHTRWQFD